MVSVFLFPFFSYINQVMIKLIFIRKYTVFVHIKLVMACRHTVEGSLGKVLCTAWGGAYRIRSTVARIVYAIRTTRHPPCKCDNVIEENEDLLILAYAIPYWKWRNDRRRERNLWNCVKKPERNSGLQRGLNPWPRHTVAMLYQLSYEATDVGSRPIVGNDIWK